MKLDLPNELAPKFCQRPILTNSGFCYDDVLCPIADRCEMRDYRDKILRIEAKKKDLLKKPFRSIRVKKWERWKLRHSRISRCCSAIYRTLKKEGYFVVQSDRANIVALEGKMKDKHGYDVSGIRLLVISDPDSGVFGVDEVFITGDRFGLDDVVVKFYLDDKITPLFSVHGSFGREGEITYLIERLLIHLYVMRGKGDVKRYAGYLKEIAEHFGVKVNFNKFL